MPIIARTREIAEALRERKSIAAVKQLLESDDPNVRAVASIAFADLAPDLSCAAVQAAYAGLAHLIHQGSFLRLASVA